MTDEILVVDDDDSLRRMMEYSLHEAGYRVSVARDGDEALVYARKNPPRLIITDLRMERVGGFELLEAVRREMPETLVVVVTAFGSIENAVEAMQRGAHDYLAKPFSRDALRLVVQRALSYSGLQRENRTLRQQLQTQAETKVLTAAPKMEAVLELVDKVAASEASVLLLGESGTGKELLARRLHHHSERAGGPFVALNCAAIPKDLIESELFGHLKGAFTGALKDRVGKFELADGGTLFLDEIGELPLAQQPKLLRALQEGEVEPVGAGTPRKVDVRVVAATHRDLAADIRAERFRDDLYYRLAVIPVSIPPLRERPEDIPYLARHFLRQLAPERDLDLTPAALEMLRRHPWPGNVRELENLMQRLAVLCRHDSIEPADLPMGLRGSAKASDSPFTLPADGYPLEELEKSAILQALDRTGGNQTRAAALLHIPRHVLIYRLEKFGLREG